MLFLRAPSGASEPLAHAVELINRDLDGLLDRLDNHQQNEFWADLHEYALSRTRKPEANTGLIAAEHVNTAVREALEMADERLTVHLRDVDSDGRARFWRMLHEASGEQMRQARQPKARHGGGGQSA